jgi:hypothetical protein
MFTRRRRNRVQGGGEDSVKYEIEFKKKTKRKEGKNRFVYLNVPEKETHTNRTIHTPMRLCIVDSSTVRLEHRRYEFVFEYILNYVTPDFLCRKRETSTTRIVNSPRICLLCRMVDRSV